MTVYHLQSAMILMRNFDGKNKNIASFYPEGIRSFVVWVPPEHVQPMKDAGWNLRYVEQGDAWCLLVKIDPEYDTDLSHLNEVGFNNAELYLEGREWSSTTGHRSGIAAFLISITPEL